MKEEEEEEAPTLRLEILQGPRQGETLDFKPGAAVRIGRVVTGNTLPIKDSGISSKHLSIVTESNKWTLRDLDSSNGTVLDGSQIPPHTPFTLHNDSTIKIGELTSIHVVFVPREQRAVQPRRNPTRRGRTEPAQPRGRGRPRGSKSKVQIQSVEENDASVVVHAESERVAPPAARVTRKSNRERSVVKESSVVENLDAPEGKIQIQSVEEKKNASVVHAESEREVEEPKKSARDLSLIEISDSSVGNSGAPPVVVEEPKNKRVTRNSKNARGVIGNVEKKTKRGVAKKRELEREGEGLNGVKEACDGREEGNLNGDYGNWPHLEGRKRELQKEGEDGNTVKEPCDGNWPDLNKMTLAEWFDFLEVHLPKQIIDETEEMIDSMTQKAERLREYIVEMQQQNGKAKMPMEE